MSLTGFRTNVTRVRSPDQPSYEGRVCFLVSLGSPVFLSPQKPTLLSYVGKQIALTFYFWSVTKKQNNNVKFGFPVFFGSSSVPGCSHVLGYSSFLVFLVLVHAISGSVIDLLQLTSTLSFWMTMVFGLCHLDL